MSEMDYNRYSQPIMPKPISTDTSSFPEIRRKGCLYVDKTAFFHKLLTGAGDALS